MVWSCEIRFLRPKRRRFSHHFFLKFYKYPKMMSFWTTRVQNSVILNQLSLIQNDVIWISDNLSKTTTLTPKRCCFLSYRDQTTSFWPRVAEKKNPCSYIPDVGQKNEKKRRIMSLCMVDAYRHVWFCKRRY